MAAAKKRKKNTEYELNINLIYHIGSHIMTKLNRLHQCTLPVNIHFLIFVTYVTEITISSY